MKYLYVFSLVFVFLFAAIFASQNTVIVPVNFLAIKSSGSLSLILAITLAGGILIGTLLMLPAVIKGSFRGFFMKRSIKKLENKKASNDCTDKIPDTSGVSSESTSAVLAPGQAELKKSDKSVPKNRKKT